MMHDVSFLSRGKKASAISIGDELEVRLTFAASRALNKPSLGMIVKDSLGQMLILVNNKFLPSEGGQTPMTRGVVRCLFDSMPLLPGRYTLDLHFGDAMRDHDVIHDAASFEVTEWDYFGTGKLPPPGHGSIAMKPRWVVCEEAPDDDCQ
jgi:lipopolysaccharide transport system ATP-binding protein